MKDDGNWSGIVGQLHRKVRSVMLSCLRSPNNHFLSRPAYLLRTDSLFRNSGENAVVICLPNGLITWHAW